MSQVSIIIPLYNSGQWIGKTLESCVNQQPFVKEIIVVDDFSTDNSITVVQGYLSRYPHLIKLIKNKIKGGNNARNAGFERSVGDYIQWLDADDLLLEDKFKCQIQALACGSADIAFSDWKQNHFDKSGNLVKSEIKRKKCYSDFLFELLVDNWSPPHSYLLTRKAAELVAEKNGWNNQTVTSQDREYFTTAAIWGLRFGYVPGLFSVYNSWSDSSVSRKLSEKARAENIVVLLSEFKNKLNQQGWISADRQRIYRSVLDSQIITLSISNDLPINLSTYNLTELSWNMINGYRTKLKFIQRFISSKVTGQSAI